MNTTIGTIPSDWKTDLFPDFVADIIDGVNKTIPGFEGMNIKNLTDYILDYIDTTLPPGLLPVDWKDKSLYDWIVYSYQALFDFVDTFIVPGMVPSNWINIEITELYKTF